MGAVPKQLRLQASAAKVCTAIIATSDIQDGAVVG